MTKYQLVTNGKFVKIQFKTMLLWHDLGVAALGNNHFTKEYYSLDACEDVQALKDMKVLRAIAKDKWIADKEKRGRYRKVLEERVGYYNKGS
jgi:hypothetical protein